MIATLPPYKHREPMGVVQASVAIALILSPFLVKLHLDQRQRQTVAGEYQSLRSTILSRIDSAAEQDDLQTLNRIHDRYSNCVSDRTFLTSIREAMAKVTAREAALEMAVSKHLDLLRHQEESAIGPDPLKPQIPPENQMVDQPLSQLPR